MMGFSAVIEFFHSFMDVCSAKHAINEGCLFPLPLRTGYLADICITSTKAFKRCKIGPSIWNSLNAVKDSGLITELKARVAQQSEEITGIILSSSYFSEGKTLTIESVI